MKTIQIIFLTLIISFFGCRNADNTLRHLIRPSTKLFQNNKNESSDNFSIRIDYKINDIKTTPDSNGFKRFEVRILLPKDTSFFKQFSVYYIADSLKLRKYPKSLVKALYLYSDSTSYKTIHWLYSQNPKKETGVDVIQDK